MSTKKLRDAERELLDLKLKGKNMLRQGALRQRITRLKTLEKDRLERKVDADEREAHHDGIKQKSKDKWAKNHPHKRNRQLNWKVNKNKK